MITSMDIQNKLIKAIKNSGKTQVQTAKSMGITQSCIAHYVKGDKMPSLDTFANLCVVLDLDANDILCLPVKL